MSVPHAWIDQETIAELPTSGPAWDALDRDAQAFMPGAVDLSDQDAAGDVELMALALRWARLREAKDLERVRSGLALSVGTERGGRALALARNLQALAIAADIVGHKERDFLAWVRAALRETLDGRTVISTHEDRPNNWGTHAGAARMLADAYLARNGSADQQAEAIKDGVRAAEVFRGWLGDRTVYHAFSFGDLWWQSDAKFPRGINPRGAAISGHSVDGVLPDDQRRAGVFGWPPPRENYVWEALQGAVVQAHVAARMGLDSWAWSDSALLRALTWLHREANYPASGDDKWIPHLVNWAYRLTGSATAFPAAVPTRPGKGVGYTDWTHGRGARP